VGEGDIGVSEAGESDVDVPDETGTDRASWLHATSPDTVINNMKE